MNCCGVSSYWAVRNVDEDEDEVSVEVLEEIEEVGDDVVVEDESVVDDDVGDDDCKAL